MKYVYAALLLHSSGQKVDEESMQNVLRAAGGNVEEARIKALVAALSEVDIDEAIKPAPGIAAIPAPVAPAAAPAPAEKKEEKEEKEEEALAGLSALFGP
ncbi:MAG: 50S ribosomal protein P1 [Candidatus Bathyarchaeia archaeon]